MADKKIPILTEIYQPKANVVAEPEVEIKARRDDAAMITPELIARIAAHIKPRLEADITKTVTENLRQALKAELIDALQDEVINTQASIEARTVDFVDKTKADLKTELPRMYQASADLVYSSLEQKISELQTNAVSKADELLSDGTQTALQQANTQINMNIEALQAEISMSMRDELTAHLSAFQTQSISQHQAQLANEFGATFQALNENAQADLHAQASTLRADTLAEMRNNFITAMPDIYTATVAEQQEAITQHISQQLTIELQAFQAKSLATHQAQLGETLTSTFNAMSESAKQDLQVHTGTLQADTLAEMRNNFIAAMPDIYTVAVAEQQEAITQHISQQLTINLQAFQAKSLSTHQAQLGETLTSTFNAVNDNVKQDIQEQMRLLQADITAQMRTTINEAIPSIYQAAADDVQAKFAEQMTAQTAQVRDSFLATVNADLPAVQEVMRENIQHVLAGILPTLETDLRNQLTSELQDLLLRVKFVLPK